MSTQVTPFTVVFPDCYDERAALEAPAKGYLRDVEVHLEDGSRYKLFFIDPVRLSQDLEEETRWGRPYYSEPGMVVLSEVTTESIRNAIVALWREGFFNHLRPLN